MNEVRSRKRSYFTSPVFNDPSLALAEVKCDAGFAEETGAADLGPEENILGTDLSDGSHKVGDLPPVSKQFLDGLSDVQRGASLCIAVVGATGELARGKIFPALFALYYSGYLPEVWFWYS